MINAILDEYSKFGKTKAIFINTLANDGKQSIREGAQEDLKSLKAACKACGFNFEYKTTTCNDDLENLCQNLANENFTKSSKIVMFILAHGNQNDEIVSHNGNFLHFHIYILFSFSSWFMYQFNSVYTIFIPFLKFHLRLTFNEISKMV